MYCCKYAYGCGYDQLRGISAWLKGLYKNSCDHYDSYVFGNNSILKREYDLIKIGELVGYVEDYVKGLIDLGYINNESKSILKKLTKLQVISLLECDNDVLTGINDSDKIFINFDLDESDNLTGPERRRLYVCKQLTKFLHSDWNKGIESYNNWLRLSGNVDQFTTSGCLDEFFISRGFNLLDEAISQDVAENITYYISKKERPFRTYSSNQSMFDGFLYKTNFDRFGGIEESAIKFGRTLKCIGSSVYDSDEDVLKKLSIRSFNQDFVYSIVGEYGKSIYCQKDLYDMLFSMGKILDANCSFDNGNFEDNSIYFSPCYLVSFEQICDKYKNDSVEKHMVKAL